MTQQKPSNQPHGETPPKPRRRRRKKPNPHSLHRMRAHEASQEDARNHPPVVVPDHPLICKDDPLLIETPDALADLIDHVRAIGSFAYDTEFIGELSYYPRLCLVQIATHERIALVDPLSNLNLDVVRDLIIDPAIATLVHAGLQDLMPIARLTGKPPANIFDTQIASGMAGLSYPLGLARLIEELFDISLGKGLTFTHWDHRPLSPMHLGYAADDVRYLPAIRAALQERLDERGHSDWADAECAAVAESCSEAHQPELLYRRVKGAQSLRPRRLAVLRELTMLRDQAARAHDVPPRSLFKDAVLLDLARNPVKSVEKLSKIPGLPRRVAQAYGEAMVSTTLAALELPKDDLPVLPDYVRETPKEQVRIESLNALAANLCHACDIAPGLAVNRKDIVQLYFALQRGRDLQTCRLMQNWRRKLLGEPLRDFIEGSRTIAMKWEGGRMRLVDG